MKELIQHVIVVAALLAIGLEKGKSQTVGCFEQLVPNRGLPGKRPMLHDLKLDGAARGGELVLMEIFNPSPRYIRVETHPGESAEIVMARMAAAVNEVSPFNPNRKRMRIPNQQGELVSGEKVPIIRAEGNWLKSFSCAPGDYIWGGDRNRLGDSSSSRVAECFLRLSESGSDAALGECRYIWRYCD